jgi:thioredoxin reductase (NADPH)
MQTNKEEIVDIIIVGSGPIGLACALAAKKNGLNYLILEKGCLVNSLYHYPVNMTFFSTSERLEIGGIPFVSNNAKPTRNEALEYYRRVAVSASLKMKLFEEVLSVEPIAEKLFNVKTVKNNYITKNIIVATGFYGLPFLLNIPGEDLPKVTHYYNDPHYYAFQKVIVVGANNSAVDAALETWRKGAEVTMVIREDQIGERVKYWVRPDIINRIKEGTIKAYFNAQVIEIQESKVVIGTPEGNFTIPNDCVIAATGYQPDLDLLSVMGIKLSTDTSKRPVYDEETHESNIKGIYLAGVICGGMDTHSLFIENSREHAEKIIDHIVSNLN